MEFEARMIDETDFHGIRRLLQQVRVHISRLDLNQACLV